MTDVAETPTFQRRAYVSFTGHNRPAMILPTTGDAIVTVDYNGPPTDTPFFTQIELDILKKMILADPKIRESGVTSVVITFAMWLAEDAAPCVG